MRRHGCWLLLILLSAALPGAARADHPGADSWMLWLGVNGNQAQLVGPTTGEISTFQSPEIGLHVAAARFVSDEWTLQVAGGYDAARSRFAPTSPSAPTETVTSRSWQIRVGGDRFAFLNDKVAIYGGPGLTYWSGYGRYESTTPSPISGNWPTVTQYGFNGRIGMWARLSGSWGLFGHLGQTLATNHASDSNGKNDWWTSHTEGSVGVSFDL